MNIILTILLSLILCLLVIMYYYTQEDTDEDTNITGPKFIKLKQQIYRDILVRTKRAFDRLNIKFFLSSGTCLGYFREGKFIDHDYDIDIGVFKNDYSPDIIESMKKEGFKLYRVWGEINNGMELSFYIPNTPLGMHAKIDLFLHYRNVGKPNTISWFTYSPSKKKIHYRVKKFSLKKVNFLGLHVYVPYPTVDYIEEHYGLDWMIPKKPNSDYSYYRSPTSIVKEEI